MHPRSASRRTTRFRRGNAKPRTRGRSRARPSPRPRRVHHGHNAQRKISRFVRHGQTVSHRPRHTRRRRLGCGWVRMRCSEPRRTWPLVAARAAEADAQRYSRGRRRFHGVERVHPDGMRLRRRRLLRLAFGCKEARWRRRPLMSWSPGIRTLTRVERADDDPRRERGVREAIT